MCRFLIFVSWLVFALASLHGLEIARLAPAMMTRHADDGGIARHLPFTRSMKLCGFLLSEEDGKYECLPVLAPFGQITCHDNSGFSGHVALSQSSALILSSRTGREELSFRTGRGFFLVNAEVQAAACIDHMAFSGRAFFDLCVKSNNGRWRRGGVSGISLANAEYTPKISSGLRHEMRDVIIKLPLYKGLNSFAPGLGKDARIKVPASSHEAHSCAFYGTSSIQRECAMRSEMASSSTLSQILASEVVNGGFSGNGGPEIADMSAVIPDASLYIPGYVLNVNVDACKAGSPGFIDVRGALNGCLDAFARPFRNLQIMRDKAKEECQRRNSAGDDKNYYFGICELRIHRDF